MSKIGKKPLNIPQGVEVELAEGLVKVTGPKGTLSWNFPHGVKIEKTRLRQMPKAEKTQKGRFGTCRRAILIKV